MDMIKDDNDNVVQMDTALFERTVNDAGGNVINGIDRFAKRKKQIEMKRADANNGANNGPTMDLTNVSYDNREKMARFVIKEMESVMAKVLLRNGLWFNETLTRDMNKTWTLMEKAINKQFGVGEEKEL